MNMGSHSNLKRRITYDESTNREFIEKYLLHTQNDYVEKQMRALYEVREIYKEEVDEIIRILCFALKNNDSVLLRHEIAYVLGQISHEECNDILINLLKDEEEHVMVRHEAAEGLAAVGSFSNIEVIKKYLYDKHVEIRETCELALHALLEKNNSEVPLMNNICSCLNKQKENARVLYNGSEKSTELHESNTSNEEASKKELSRFQTIDPVVLKENYKSIEELIQILKNDKAPLPVRYEALFALRNLETEESVHAICESLITDKSSAIFRHEVAFVLGQILHLNSLQYLITSLSNEQEHEMVRHEAALALGALGSLNLKNDEYKIIQETIIQALRNYSKDSCRVVAESCLVGLDYICEQLNISIEV